MTVRIYFMFIRERERKQGRGRYLWLLGFLKRFYKNPFKFYILAPIPPPSIFLATHVLPYHPYPLLRGGKASLGQSIKSGIPS